MKRPSLSPSLLPFDKITLSYALFVALLLLLSHPGVKGWYLYLISHLLYCLLVIYLIRCSTNRDILDPLRYLYPLLSVPLFYQELRILSYIIFAKPFDKEIISLEIKLLGLQPNLFLQDIARPWLTDFFNLFYFSYYFMVFLPPLFLYIEGRKEELSYLLTNIMLAYSLSFALSIFLPVESPRFALQGKLHPLHGILFTPFHEGFMAMGSFRGNGMPSSHVAVTLVAVACMRRINKKVFWIMLPSFSAMSSGAIYGSYHYLSDVIGGLLTGAFVLLLSPALLRRRPLFSR